MVVSTRALSPMLSFLFELAWASRIRLPILIATTFMVTNIHMRLEINVNFEMEEQIVLQTDETESSEESSREYEDEDDSSESGDSIVWCRESDVHVDHSAEFSEIYFEDETECPRNCSPEGENPIDEKEGKTTSCPTENQPVEEAQCVTPPSSISPTLFKSTGTDESSQLPCQTVSQPRLQEGSTLMK